MAERSSKKVYLFNCDNTYKLDVVEKFLLEVDEKHSLDISTEKLNFRLNSVTEICENTIPQLQMDVATFVVHAEESRLSINEDNAGIGYAKIYKALLEATGDKVLIVIGGDDHYGGEGEEKDSVISRWARRKVASQFNEEYLDGRKSFVFSWNKKHREIHEEALLHFFDPSKKGQKFEYQPKPKPVPVPIREEPDVTPPEDGGTHEEFVVEDDQKPLAQSDENEHKHKPKSESEAPNIDQPAAVEIQQKEPESSLQEPVSEEEAMDSHIDEHDSSESDIQVSSEDSPSSTTSIKLMTYLRYGKISYASKDVLTWDGSWQPPASEEEKLKQQWKSDRLKKLTISVDETGEIKEVNVSSPTLRDYCSIS